MTGKLIIPFCTSGESDIAETMPTFLDSCDGLAVYGAKRITGTGQLNDWLSALGLGNNGTESPTADASHTAAVVQPNAISAERTGISRRSASLTI